MGNIREVAKLAGVSVTTASRVFNGHPYVADEKRKAVIDAAEKLNYTKNINAVHLSKGKTNAVGIILPFLDLPYYGQWLQGIAEEAMKKDFSLQVFQTNYQKTAEIDALYRLKSRQVDGLIIASRTNDWAVISPFTEDGPIIMCENVPHSQYSTVYINHYDTFQKGLKTLREKGHVNIGLCIHRIFGTNSQERLGAYQDFYESNHETPKDKWIFTDCYTIDDGKNVLKKWMGMEDRPTALMVTSDQVAAGVVSEAKKNNINIPGELAIMSSDNHPISELLDITSIHIPIKEMGKRAFQLFFHACGGENSTHEELDTTIFMRGTV